ncbi:MAG: PilZ domain-containing protein [Mariprofundaceae bacterium]
MVNESGVDKREFERFSVGFHIRISSHDDVELIELSTIENISGGGISFLSRKSDQYFIGQTLEIAICLPGSEEVKALMKSSATVMRLTDGSVGVRVDDMLSFERDGEGRPDDCGRDI